MRRIGGLLVVIALAGCGGSAATQYNVKPALECLQRTNSTNAGIDSNSIVLVFTSDDGVSAIEPVFVSFGPATLAGPVPAALGLMSREPMWIERRGDARVAGYGPFEPQIGKRRKIPGPQARAAVKALGTDVQVAIDLCLKENER